jgi:hypothetical protein
MRPRPARAALLLVTGLLTAVPVTTLGAPAARAATAYTWTGAESSAWGAIANWSPPGIPQDGDSVTLGPVGPGATPAVTSVPDVTLASLTVAGSGQQAVSLSGDGDVLVGTLQWTGGDINVDLTVSAPPLDPVPSVIQPGDTPLRFGFGGEQTLTLLSDVEVPVGLGAGDQPWLTFMFDSGLRVGSTATLRLDPAAWLAANRCCGSPTSTVVVDGTLEVFSLVGATGLTARLEQLGLDLAGDLDVPAGNTLQVRGGPVRIGGTPTNGTVGDGSIRGGGTVDLVETDGDAFVEAQPSAPDTTMKFLDVGEVLTLTESSTLRLGGAAKVSGVGSIEGSGLVELAGVELRGELTLGEGLAVSAVPGTDSRLVVWRDLPGQRGRLVLDGARMGVEPGSTLTVNSGTEVVVADGGGLSLQRDAVLRSSSCCSDPGRVTVREGGLLSVGGSDAPTGGPSVLRWVELGGAGTVVHGGLSQWDLAGTAFTTGSRLIGSGTIDGDLAAGALAVVPSRVLRVTGDFTPNAGGSYVPTALDPPGPAAVQVTGRLEVGGTARLAGRLGYRGNPRLPTGEVLDVLDAGTLQGRFRCAETPGLLPQYTSRRLSLRVIDLKAPGCLVPSSGTVLQATYAGRRRAALGVPSQATRVLLDVTLGPARGRHSVRLSGGRGADATVRAAAGRSQREYVVLGLSAARRLTAVVDRRARVSVVRVGWY